MLSKAITCHLAPKGFEFLIVFDLIYTRDDQQAIQSDVKIMLINTVTIY